jgi:hypothetical protein
VPANKRRSVGCAAFDAADVRGSYSMPTARVRVRMVQADHLRRTLARWGWPGIRLHPGHHCVDSVAQCDVAPGQFVHYLVERLASIAAMQRPPVGEPETELLLSRNAVGRGIALCRRRFSHREPIAGGGSTDVD